MSKIEVDKGICKRAIEAFGKEYMLNVAMEEPAELIQAVSKMRREREEDIFGKIHLIEEMCDVYVILEELAEIYGVEEDEINSMIAQKQARTVLRMKA